MTTAKLWIVPTVMAVATWFVVSFLDVIPAEVAPNCRPELKHFSATLTSIQSLYGFGFAFSGCEYRSVPLTSWVCVGISLVALACGALIGLMLRTAESITVAFRSAKVAASAEQTVRKRPLLSRSERRL